MYSAGKSLKILTPFLILMLQQNFLAPGNFSNLSSLAGAELCRTPPLAAV